MTGSHGLSAIVWDATTGERQMTLSGHTAHIHAAVFSPDDSRILTGSADHTAKLWDSTTGKELLTFRGHTDWVFSAAFSPDGQRIVTSSGDGTVKVWEAATRDQLQNGTRRNERPLPWSQRQAIRTESVSSPLPKLFQKVPLLSLKKCPAGSDGTARDLGGPQFPVRLKTRKAN